MPGVETTPSRSSTPPSAASTSARLRMSRSFPSAVPPPSPPGSPRRRIRARSRRRRGRPRKPLRAPLRARPPLQSPTPRPPRRPLAPSRKRYSCGLDLRGIAEPELGHRNLPHSELLNLPGDRHGKGVDDLPVLRDLVGRDLPPAECRELFSLERRSRLGLDPRHDLFPVRSRRHPHAPG